MMGTQQGSGGYGQQDPNDAAGAYNAAAFLVRQKLAELSTMIPVKVVKVTPGEGEPPAAATVDVTPLVNMLDGNGNPVEHGTVPGIPCFRPQGGISQVILDPAEGDVGFIVCAHRDISAVKATRDRANPGSRRKHNLADGVYVGSILAQAPEQYVWFKDDGIKIVDKNGNVVEMAENSVKVTVGGQTLEVTPTGITVSGNLTIAGNLLIGGEILGDEGGVYAGNLRTSGEVTAHYPSAPISLTTHQHHQGVDGHGDSEQDVSAPF